MPTLLGRHLYQSIKMQNNTRYITNPSIAVIPLSRFFYVIYIPLHNRFIKINADCLCVLYYFSFPDTLDSAISYLCNNDTDINTIDINMLLNNYVNHGILIPSGSDPVKASEQIHLPINEPLRYITMHVTPKCNLSCYYCYSNKYRKGINTRILSPSDWETIVNDAASLGVKSINITGGEPLLRMDLLPVWKHARNLGLYVQMITNATRISSSRIAKDICYAVDNLAISVDSINPKDNDTNRGIGSHKKIEQAIEYLNNVGVSWYPQITATTVSITSMKETIEYYTAKSGNKAHISVLSGTHDIDEEVYTIIEALNRSGQSVTNHECSVRVGNYCGAARSMVAIDWSGYIYPCKGLIVDEYKGNSVLEHGIASALSDSYSLNNYRHISVAKYDRCSECSFASLCFGGCRAVAFMRTGSVNGYIGDAWCKRYKQRIIEGIINSSE